MIEKVERQFLAWSTSSQQSFRTSGLLPHQHHNEPIASNAMTKSVPAPGCGVQAGTLQVPAWVTGTIPVDTDSAMKGVKMVLD